MTKGVQRPDPYHFKEALEVLCLTELDGFNLPPEEAFRLAENLSGIILRRFVLTLRSGAVS